MAGDELNYSEMAVKLSKLDSKLNEVLSELQKVLGDNYENGKNVQKLSKSKRVRRLSFRRKR